MQISIDFFCTRMTRHKSNGGTYGSRKSPAAAGGTRTCSIIYIYIIIYIDMNARAAFHTHHSAHRSPCFERENITVHVNQGPSYNAWPISTSQSFWNFKFGDESLGTHRVGVQQPLMEGEQRVLGSAAGSWSNAKQNSTCDKLWPLDPSKKIQKDEGEKKAFCACKILQTLLTSHA